MILRKASQKLIQIIKNQGEYNNVLLIEGVRQAGKTTLVRNTLNFLKIPFREFNLEERKTLTEKIDLCRDFSEFTDLVQAEMKWKIGNGEILFIDEAQESRQLGQFVRFMKEKWKNTRVILSGSSMNRIFRDDVRYPVGRVTILHLQPFSFEEFLRAGKEDFLLEKIESLSITPSLHERLLMLLQDYMEVGGLPEVVTTYFQKGDWRELRHNILLGYYNDFKRIYGEERQAYFIACMTGVSHLLGSPFKNSHISALLGGGKNQEIIRSLSRLESWKMIFHVDQRGPSVETEFHPKRYLFDTGITKHLREIAFPGIHLLKTRNAEYRTSLGGLVENVMVTVLSQNLEDFSGWRKSSSGSEVDFVVKKNGEILPVECKSALSIKNTHLGGVRDFLKIYQLPRGLLVSLAPFEKRRLSSKETIVILPLYLAERWEVLL